MCYLVYRKVQFLGPLFFVFFINDIYENIEPNTNIALNADDTKIWREIKSDNDCDILQKDIDALYTWYKNNKMFSYINLDY